MFYYLLVILLAISFFSFSLRTRNVGAKDILLILSLFILAGWAGCRDTTVGTDTWFYAEEVFDDAVHSTKMWEYIEDTKRAEPGYAFINYWVSRCTSILGWVLFIIQGLILYFVYRAILNERNLNKTLALVIYLFLFYNLSFNIIRQLLAVTCFIVGYQAYCRKEKKKFALLVLLDFCFHKTSAIAWFIFFLLKIVQNISGRKKWWLLGFICFSFLFLLYKLNDVLILVATIPTLNNYQYYTTEYQEAGSNLSDISLRLIFLGIAVYAYKREIVDLKKCEWYIMVTIIEILVFTSGVISMYAYRLAFYFSMFHVLFLPHITYKMCPKQRMIAKSIIIIPLLFVWYWLFIHHNVGATIPYKSKILGL